MKMIVATLQKCKWKQRCFQFLISAQPLHWLYPVIITNSTTYWCFSDLFPFAPSPFCSFTVAISWESACYAGCYLKFLRKCLSHDDLICPGWTLQLPSYLIWGDGNQDRVRGPLSVTVLNHVTKLQILFIHLSQEIQSVVLLELHVFIPQSCLDCSWVGFFLNIAIFVWAQSDTCGHSFFLSGNLFFFFFFSTCEKTPWGWKTLGI